MVDVEMKDASKEDKKEADNKKEEPADRFYGK